MNTKQILWNTSAIFVFLLLISGNFIGELLPCKVQQTMRENMFIKHFLGYMTLLFFVVLTLPELFEEKIITSSIVLYVFFLFFSKVYYIFWFIIVFIFGILYLVSTYYKTKIQQGTHEKQKDNKYMVWIRSSLIYTICGSTIVGFLIYMGNKKREFGKKFNFIEFLFGNPICHGKSPVVTSYWDEIKYAFK